ncbi:subclass B1 metallo-beta-lactamase [Algoriphagus sp. CAU 1675]|uniref:subclass B1 metallo-beta-lactamase n=1 Tax=Algoriphagus sp. CAU 1675 TaxID=3032597 RepID=UPI0023D99B32|nr:subclass B1 metallo-beta-lactamase [Algoriphagus sp. CAU 1675]MDF2157503.1 subclass B1 metallo-beta-lactamase [Algoriphagus sp. CAU 1675]
MKRLFFPILLMLILANQTLFAQKGQPVYQSESLQIFQLDPHTLVHVSYLLTQDFGKVACNGMVVLNEGEAIIWDSPTEDASSEELITWLEKEKKVQVKAVVATHFHNDCLGGLESFHSREIDSYGSFKTLTLAKQAGEPVPRIGFEEELILKAGGIELVSRFLGEGHTPDNVVAYVPAAQVLFGGCLIKEVGASVGYLGDANTGEWSATVTRVKMAFPEVKTVIPGHGKVGSSELLDYTIRLFEDK